MSSVTTPLIKPLSIVVVQCSLTSSQGKLSKFLSLPFKPTKLSLTSSSWVSLKTHNNFSSNLVPLVAQTSDWARQDEEEGNAIDEEGVNWENEEVNSDTEAVAEISEEGFLEEQSEEESYAPPPEDAKLYVGNLPYDIDSEKLAQIFDQAGIVEMAEIIYNRETDRSRGFGFVTMRTVEEAEKAVEMFHRYDLNGRMLTVNKAAPRGSQPEQFPREREPSFRIYVGNLPWQVDDARLEQVFSEHGKVVKAQVVYDRDSGRSRGFGFVTMSTQTELDDAIAALDGQTLDGRAIRVNVAEERPRRGF